MAELDFTVGTDTYISVTDADNYVEKHYTTNDPFRLAWGSLYDDDKQIYLRNATTTIDSLTLTGKKKDMSQTLQFPRAYQNNVYYSEYDEDYEYYNGYYSQIVVPEDVKNAQVEIAIFNTDEQANQRLMLQAQGVTSFSMGDLSENYGKSKAIYSLEAILKSPKAIKIMRKYIGGTFNVI
jgi:hypothetical protein